MRIDTPAEFSFELCLAFLKRSPDEMLHELTGEGVTKAVRVAGETAVFSVQEETRALRIDFLTKGVRKSVKQATADYVREWFDLDTDLRPFYAMASKDKLLKELIKRYYGYRIVGQPDLF